MYIYTFFIHLHIDGHLDCFHILATVNKATVNIAVDISFQISVFVSLGKHPEVETLDDLVYLLIVIFEDCPYCFPQWFNQFTFPPIVYQSLLFSTSSSLSFVVFLIIVIMKDVM